MISFVGGSRQRSSGPDITAQTNARAAVNGIAAKRRREFDPEEFSETFVEKRTFYKEVTKLCGSVSASRIFSNLRKRYLSVFT